MENAGSFVLSCCPSHNVFEQAVEPGVDAVWCVEVRYLVATMCWEEFADCSVDGKFFSEDQACFVRPFVDVGEFGAMFYGDAEQFGNSLDPVCVES